MLSSHLFLCLPCLLPPFTVPCEMVLAGSGTCFPFPFMFCVAWKRGLPRQFARFVLFRSNKTLSFNLLCVLDQLVEHQTGTPPTLVPFPGAASLFFSSRVHFQCRLAYGVRTPLCAVACIYICVHVKDPVVHVRVQCIMETLKQPECTVGWVARLCRSWLLPGKATRISYGRNPIGTRQL